MRLMLRFLLIGGLLTGAALNGIAESGPSRVTVARDENGRWDLLVNGHPYLVKGIEFSPDAAGCTPEAVNEWMSRDENENLKCDAAYDSWVDENRDNYQDAEEDAVGDFELLRQMGCNTIRIYHSENVKKKVLRELYENYGIRVIMGNYLGAYTQGSGALWGAGTDYSDPQQCEKMKASVARMVEEHKDEPYLLMYMLGNENDTSGSYDNSTFNNTNAQNKPERFAQFVDEVCGMIKQMDPAHPVGVCNGSQKMLPYYRDFAPRIDIIGYNSYQGPYGFGTLWQRTKETFDRPVLITEYGTDSFNQKTGKVDEAYQARYHRGCWNDIVKNSYNGDGMGNAIGGVVFCWMDKWWLCGTSKTHDTEVGGWSGPTIDGWFNDEWLGVCGQGDGMRAPFMRQPRRVYYLYKDELWCDDPPAESD